MTPCIRHDRPWLLGVVIVGLSCAVALAVGIGCAIHNPPSSSSYVLEGAHLDLTCSDCHAGDWDTPPDSSCNGCHADERPVPHWQEDCGECHGQVQWDDLDYEHEEWPLTGAHLDAECAACHLEVDFDDDVDDHCLGCHEDDQPPGHPGMDCGNCHNTTAWDPPDWTHDSFPLEGYHDGVGCMSCHTSGWDDTPSECSACHTTPAGHPTQWACSQCHDIHHTFEEPPWNHGFFPLEGGHDYTNVGCTDCHASGYAGTPDSCEDCHLDDRPSAFHWSSGCGTCHNIYSW